MFSDAGTSDEQSISLANESQMLLLNRASIRAIMPIIHATYSTITEDDLLNRFRANLIIDGCEPFAEDTWHILRVGNVKMEVR